MDRIQKYSGGEIRFNLMAVIKNRQVLYGDEKERLESQLNALKQQKSGDTDQEKKMGHIKASIQRVDGLILREREKMEGYRVRRNTHNHPKYFMMSFS
jgi:ubiquitin carboxyl-terminal hydrolase L5